MYGVVARWIRAFHAALYMQPLPPNTRFATELPFEVISPLGNGQHIIDGGRPRQRTLCEETITSNRLTKTLDRIVAWNGKLQYECVWVLTALHAYCVFWLDFYHWDRLARRTAKGLRWSLRAAIGRLACPSHRRVADHHWTPHDAIWPIGVSDWFR